ncbi:hypothetical protein LAT59_01720 [Candidatus Gracilibacteria bacterium]|nr:hypothetical protein [Candidatus Gracilibacteria bacterium]
MRIFLYIFLGYLSIVQTYALSIDIQGNSNNILGIDNTRLREGRVGLSDIPLAIRNAIDFFMGIAATVAVIFIVIGAYKILFGSLQQDKTKGRDTIIAALGGFALAALSWMIIRLIISNFS